MVHALLHLLRSPLGTFETFGRDVRMSARGETGHCGNIVVGPNLTRSRLRRRWLPPYQSSRAVYLESEFRLVGSLCASINGNAVR